LLVRLRRMLLSTVFLFALVVSFSYASSVPVGVRDESRCCHLSDGLMAKVGSQSSEHGVIATGKHSPVLKQLQRRKVRMVPA